METRSDRTAPQSPWQNPYVERLIGSIRRECLNHIVILNAKYLKRTLRRYFDYYLDPAPILLFTSNALFQETCRAGRIIEIPSSGDFTIAMNVLPRNDFPRCSIMANHSSQEVGEHLEQVTLR